MRVFYAISNYSRYVDTDTRDLIAALRATECDFIAFDWEIPFPLDLRQWNREVKHQANLELLAAVKQAHAQAPLDFFLTAADATKVEEETVRAIQELGVPAVSCQWDDPIVFQRIYARLVKVYDINWTVNPSTFPMYKSYGAQYFFTPVGANPELCKPRNETKSIDVSFVGTNYGYREEYLIHLMRAGVNVRVHGKGWPTHAGGIPRRLGAFWLTRRGMPLRTRITNTSWYLSNLLRLNRFFGPPLCIPSGEISQLIGRSRINLSFCGSPVGPFACDFSRAPRSMKLRDFEVTMSGGFLLTEQWDELAKLFDVGKEVVMFTGKRDMLDKVQYYLAHEAEAKAIAAAGRRKALRDYTWTNHMKKLLSAVRDIKVPPPARHRHPL